MKGSYSSEEIRCLSWRGLEPGEECPECDGSGVLTYGSTATWRGGIGGAMMTTDVCDKCWGSGNKQKPWPNRRATIVAR